MLIELLPLLMFFTLMALVFTSYPIGFVLGGVAILFGLIGSLAGVFSLGEFFLFASRIWFIADNLQIIAVPLFVFMGVMLERAEIAKDLLETLQILLRRVPGGMAMAVTVMSTVFAAITGIIGATVVVMTLIALPPMLKAGYSLAMPAAVPPLKRAATTMSARHIVGIIIRGVLPPVALIGMVMGSILTGFVTITESASVGAAGALLLAAARGNLTWNSLQESLHRSAMMIGMVFFLFIGATCFSYVFRVLGGDDLILALVDHSGVGSWGILLIAIGLIFVMGFFFDVLEILLVVVPVFAPLVAGLDFGDHLAQGDIVYWFAILVAITLQTSFLTPPMGLALFYIKGVAPTTISMNQIYRGIIPFVILQMLCVTLVMIWPQIAMWLPHQLFD